ncbi:hypothetical protein BDM02DRAFT_3112988, partial [Thelephora ganbajun]
TNDNTSIFNVDSLPEYGITEVLPSLNVKLARVNDDTGRCLPHELSINLPMVAM